MTLLLITKRALTSVIMRGFPAATEGRSACRRCDGSRPQPGGGGFQPGAFYHRTSLRLASSMIMSASPTFSCRSCISTRPLTITTSTSWPTAS